MMSSSYFNRDFLNRSPIFTFYRARLIRSYLRAANLTRFVERAQRPTRRFPKIWAGGQSAVPTQAQDLHEREDVPMAEYVPYTSGGPVHLINICVNQAVDP